MRPARPVLVCALLISTAAATVETSAPAQDSNATEHYVPEGLWDEQRTDFREHWFGHQLRAMNEPVLSRQTDREGYRRRFRMLVLPAFHPAYAIRIDERTGEGRVRAVRLDGNGGYGPGVIAQQEQYSLNRDEMREIDRAIDASGVAFLSPDPGPEGQICVDGVQFVFELVDEGGSRFITRHECDLNRELRTLVEQIDGPSPARGIGSVPRYGLLRGA